MNDYKSMQRRGPYSHLPDGAQDLLMTNQETLRKLPRQMRAFLISALVAWDDFFPQVQEKYRRFLRKVSALSRKEIREAFRGSLPPLPRNPPQEGRRRRPNITLTTAQIARIGEAFDRFVYEDYNAPPSLIVLAFSRAGEERSRPVFSDSLAAQGTVLTAVTYPKGPDAWLATFLTGRQDALKGRNLRSPSLFESHNRQIEDKTGCKTFAFYFAGQAPPRASTVKGFGKKYAPLTVQRADVERAAKTVRTRLGEARQKGKSENYIAQMVKPKLTPEALGLHKSLKNKALSRLVTHALMASDENLDLGNSLARDLCYGSLILAEPDLCVVQLEADGDPENEEFLSTIWSDHRRLQRFRDRTTVAVLDSGSGQALLLGPDIPVGTAISTPHSLEDLSVTLSGLAHIKSEHADGTPLPELVAR